MLLFIAAMTAVVWFTFDFYQFFSAPLIKSGPDTSIKVYPGTTIRQLIDELKQRQLLQHDDLFLMYARYKDSQVRLRYGEYLITPSTTAPQLLKNIINGTGLFDRQITFIEGWTFNDIKNALANNPNVRHTILNKTNAQIMQMLGKSDLHPEGQFFPDTYNYTWGNSDVDILQKAYEHMQKCLQTQWPTRAANLPYENAYQALIVASLVEKESALNKERPLIAGVIINRLRKGMRLQVDPTVLYGISGSFNGAITQEDLKAKNPYNTYVIKGLPPTPIGMPGASSINAALHPVITDSLYYVAKGDGSHIFSNNYQQHLIAVKSYVAQKNSWYQVMRSVFNNGD